MASDADTSMTQQHPADIVMDDNDMASPVLQPATPQDLGSQDLSQVTLPSTEIPQSPIDPNESFKTETNDDRPAITIIPSSLTPPPSTQVNNHVPNGHSKRTFSGSQQSLFSPPATILNTLRDRQLTSDFVPPASQQVLEASADELRIMLQGCIAENQKLKMETAHHKLQYNLLSLQADEDQKRAIVEHEMIRREVDALRTAEHTRQAKRELSTSSDSTHAKYLQMKMWYEAAVDEAETLQRRVKVAKKVIQQKEEETISLTEERDMLLNRIRENREHLHSMCSPGGIFHGALTPKQQTQAALTPQLYRSTPRHTPRAAARETREGEHGLSALLQAMSQDNNSAPSTPLPSHRPAPRQVRKHQRNAQSMSSLPTTPMNRSRSELTGLLPSVDLVPQTEPQRYPQRLPMTPVTRPERRRQSRESTISVEDNEELARQALQSVAAASFASQASLAARGERSRDEDDEEVFDSQASQAATELLLRDPRQSFEVASSTGSRGGTHSPVDKSARMQAKLFSNSKGDGEKRRFSGNHGSNEDVMRDQGSPAKKIRVGGSLAEERRRGLSAVLTKAPTDTVILSALRTPVCRSYKGGLKDAFPEELLANVLRATLEANPNLDPAAVQDVAVGVVLSELGGSKAARMAMNHVGYPNSTSLYTVNRACSSSLQAIASVSAQIRVGAIDAGIGAGMESMTRNYGSRAIPVDLWPELRDSPNHHARDCIMPMGLTSENVAERYNVSRADQDALAAESHRRAAHARSQGFFDAEIVPVTTRFQEVDKQGNAVGEAQTITVTADDGIREGVTAEKLAKLKPAFKPDGASTAGNSSQVSDGAAAALIMRRSTATALGLGDRIIGKFVSAVTVGCDPDEMGVGPAVAIPKLLAQHDLTNDDINRWEINEAFASQALYSIRSLGLEDALAQGRVNPDGGAIALGHPLGATGARLTSTLLHGLGRTGGEVGVVSMCIGTGMGMAGLFTRE
ncbi:Thiolase, N-terminal domain-containing protein [Dactylonectria macrodidyma]|uniref:acetyl-CoA C-acyltransferase n=1 Tax=Dactylonectria macrodidyma TaxID=307937 RepID=A0A9P9FSJ1_9HYPO|nr:Thiolase, N-terminal domain-containing protein [Dactylonectria macrodidyma]